MIGEAHPAGKNQPLLWLIAPLERHCKDLIGGDEVVVVGVYVCQDIFGEKPIPVDVFYPEDEIC